MNSLFKYGTIVKYLKISSQFFALWPLKLNAGVLSSFFQSILWYFYLVNGLYMEFATFFGTYCCSSTLNEVMKSITEATYIFESLCSLIHFRKKKLLILLMCHMSFVFVEMGDILRNNIEFSVLHSIYQCKLLTEIEHFEKISTTQDKVLMQRFLKRTQLIYIMIPAVFGTGALLFILSPFVTSGRAVPLNTVYIFLPTTEFWSLCIVYALNVVIIIQAANVVAVDLIVVTLIWRAVHKFELVQIPLQCNIEKGLKEFVELHQDAISYVKEINEVIAPMLVKVLAGTSTYMITCSLLVLYNVPFFEISQFFLITIFSCMRLLVYSWSADIMTNEASNVRWRIYNLSWKNTSTAIHKNILIILHRCQKPVIIHATGIVSSLSLKFCGLVLYKTFTSFMTLRTILKV